MKEKAWEYEGKTVDEAIQIALEELGLEREDIHVEILEEPQKGFLGIGGKGAVVKVELIGEWEVLGKKETGTEEVQTEITETGENEYLPTKNTEKPVRMINEILEIFEIDAMVEAKDKEESVIVDVWGEDIAILIGKGGNTLDALQYLINVSCRRTGDVEKRIIVDIEGYRKRRKARIEKQAEQMARKVLDRGKSIELQPMSPSERKIVHMALKDFKGVVSESEGEGSERRVVIRPDN